MSPVSTRKHPGFFPYMVRWHDEVGIRHNWDKPNNFTSKYLQRWGRQCWSGRRLLKLLQGEGGGLAKSWLSSRCCSPALPPLPCCSSWWLCSCLCFRRAAAGILTTGSPGTRFISCTFHCTFYVNLRHVDMWPCCSFPVLEPRRFSWSLLVGGHRPGGPDVPGRAGRLPRRRRPLLPRGEGLLRQPGGRVDGADGRAAGPDMAPWGKVVHEVWSRPHHEWIAVYSKQWVAGLWSG